MKKVKYLAAAALLLALAACSEKKSSLPTDGVLGEVPAIVDEYGHQLYSIQDEQSAKQEDRSEELDKLRNKFAERLKEIDFNQISIPTECDESSHLKALGNALYSGDNIDPSNLAYHPYPTLTFKVEVEALEGYNDVSLLKADFISADDVPFADTPIILITGPLCNIKMGGFGGNQVEVGTRSTITISMPLKLINLNGFAKLKSIRIAEKS